MNYKHIEVTGYIPTRHLLDQKDLAIKMEQMKRDNLREVLEVVISEGLGIQEVEYDITKQHHVIKTHIYVGDPNA